MTIHIFGFYRTSVINKLTRYNGPGKETRDWAATDTNQKMLKRAAIFYSHALNCQLASSSPTPAPSPSSSSSSSSFHLCVFGPSLWMGLKSNANAQSAEMQTDKCRRTRKVKVNFILFIYLFSHSLSKRFPKQFNASHLTTLFNIGWSPAHNQVATEQPKLSNCIRSVSCCCSVSVTFMRNCQLMAPANVNVAAFVKRNVIHIIITSRHHQRHLHLHRHRHRQFNGLPAGELHFSLDCQRQHIKKLQSKTDRGSLNKIKLKAA